MLDPDTTGAVAPRRAIAALPHRQKAVLVLHFYADMTFAQIAEQLQMPENTAKSSTRRAVATLRSDPQLVDLKEVGDAI